MAALAALAAVKMAAAIAEEVPLTPIAPAVSTLSRRLPFPVVTGQGEQMQPHCYDIRFAERTGYILEEHFVTVCEG